MKRLFSILIVILIISSMTACGSQKEITSVKDGVYVLEQIGADEAMLPSLTISDGNIIFSYDFLSSYLPYGTYTIEDNIMIMKTDDGKYKYVFEIDGNTLIFQKEDSSEVTLIDEKTGIKITDDAEFKMAE